jgi:hypothetical protein
LRRYVDAFAARRRGAPTSASWRAAFDAASDSRISVVQHLLLGMNAHINFDLALAVSDALEPGELSEFARDYQFMNELLDSLIEDVTARMAKFWPLLGKINRIVHETDDVIVDFSMKRARANAWRCMERLEPLAGAERQRFIADFDAQAARLARRVAHPSGVGGLVAIAVHAGERGSVAEIITALRQD